MAAESKVEQFTLQRKVAVAGWKQVVGVDGNPDFEESLDL